MVGKPRLPWGRKEAPARAQPTPPREAAAAPRSAPAAPRSSPAPAPAAAAPPVRQEAPPLPRPAPNEHHWLTVAVARPGPVAPVPVPGARVVARPYPRGASAPEDPIGRGTTGPDGTCALLLPPGRYALSASHEGEGRAVTVTLEHAGRATLLLESLQRRVALTIEVARPDGRPLAHALLRVHAAAGGGGSVVAEGATDESGVETLALPPGAYEVVVGEARVRTYVEVDTRLRLTAASAPEAAPAEPTRYAHKVRSATHYAAPFDVGAVRDEGWN